MDLNERYDVFNDELKRRVSNGTFDCNELYDHSPSSYEYELIRCTIMSKLQQQPKYFTNVLAVHRSEIAGHHMGAIRYISKSSDMVEYRPKFSKEVTFVHIIDNEDIRILPRWELEYNPSYRQLVVAAFITDGKNLILLKNTVNTRIQNKITMIQGHVDFTPEAYTQTQIEFLYTSIHREINEELKRKGGNDPVLVKDSNIPNPSYILNLSNNFIDIEHTGIVYTIKVDDAVELFSKITTAEEENHEVILIPLNQIHKYEDQFDNWLKPVIELYKEDIEFGKLDLFQSSRLLDLLCEDNNKGAIEDEFLNYSLSTTSDTLLLDTNYGITLLECKDQKYVISDKRDSFLINHQLDSRLKLLYSKQISEQNSTEEQI
ncbi:hypothetical protein D1872_36640 [compost metagenome]